MTPRLVRDNFHRATGGTFSVHLCTLFGCHNELREDWTKPKSGIQHAFRLWGARDSARRVSEHMYCKSVSASRRVKLRAACAKTSSTVSITPRSHSSDAIDMNRRANFSCIDVREILQRYFQVSPWRSLFWCLESVMLWRGIMGFTKFGDKRVNDLDLLSGYVVGVACLHRENPCRRICMQLAPRTSGASVLYLSFLFAMLCSSSFYCIFICTNPKQTLLMSARSSFH